MAEQGGQRLEDEGDGVITLELPRHPKCKKCHKRIAGDVVWLVGPLAGFVLFEDGAEVGRAAPYHAKHVPPTAGENLDTEP